MPINRIEKSLGTALLAFLAGMAYRMGGSGNWPRWVREVGVGILLILEFLLLGLFNWGCLLILGSVWVESTYFKIKGETNNFSWVLVGLSFSIAILPWFVWGWAANRRPAHWAGYLVRTVVCAFLTWLWNQVLSAKLAKATGLGKDIMDENGRGVIQLLTLPLVLIG